MKRQRWLMWCMMATGAVTLPVTLVAQTLKCDIKDDSPYQVNGAKQYILAAATAKRPDEVPKHLANSIRVLTDNADRINNEPGRQFMLLRTYAQYLQVDGAPLVMKRGVVGFTSNPQGSHNLLLAVDSAATVIERLMPQCQIGRAHV